MLSYDFGKNNPAMEGLRLYTNERTLPNVIRVRQAISMGPNGR